MKLVRMHCSLYEEIEPNLKQPRLTAIVESHLGLVNDRQTTIHTLPNSRGDSDLVPKCNIECARMVVIHTQMHYASS